jgi:expansin (peptidoglycan-binding protein)
MLLAGVLVACGTDHAPHEPGDLAASHPPRTDSGSNCIGQCDAAAPSVPVITESVSHGDVTTYGGVGNANPSSGGACNYGVTGITHYAAIQVNQVPGDLRGQWNGGKACGRCFEVRARTPGGWKSTHVRIVDKCPDGFCGIDLGGAPATDLMGIQAGRYSGEWRPVSCQGLPGVSDGPVALHVKEGSNRWWSLVQVRNPLGAVREIRLRQDLPGAPWTSLPWATEAENFFKVPQSILQDSVPYRLQVLFESDSTLEVSTTPTALSLEGNRIPLP